MDDENKSITWAQVVCMCVITKASNGERLGNVRMLKNVAITKRQSMHKWKKINSIDDATFRKAGKSFS
jgi:hypothetical protein